MKLHNIDVKEVKINKPKQGRGKTRGYDVMVARKEIILEKSVVSSG